MNKERLNELRLDSEELYLVLSGVQFYMNKHMNMNYLIDELDDYFEKNNLIMLAENEIMTVYFDINLLGIIRVLKDKEHSFLTKFDDEMHAYSELHYHTKDSLLKTKCQYA